VLELLAAYFGCVVPAIAKAGGEADQVTWEMPCSPFSPRGCSAACAAALQGAVTARPPDTGSNTRVASCVPACPALRPGGLRQKSANGQSVGFHLARSGQWATSGEPPARRLMHHRHARAVAALPSCFRPAQQKTGRGAALKGFAQRSIVRRSDPH